MTEVRKQPTEKIVSPMTSLASFPGNFRLHDQNPDERILLFIRKHKVILLLEILGYSLLLFVPVFVQIVISYMANALFNGIEEVNTFFSSKFWIIIWMVWIAYLLKGYYNIFFKWFYNINLLTDNRFIDFDFIGIFRNRIEETSILNIQDAKDSQKGLLQSLFNMGNMEVLTASENTVFNLDNIPSSHKARDFVMDVVIAKKQEK
ncbi:MAG: hypothetical protein ACOCXT_00710 [Candidatus Dojkabacteria bacterium]